MMPSQFQYFQPPTYYAQVPQNVPSAPQAPLINLNDTHIAVRENEVDQDARLARELQAKFDNE
jgi:hypothetical protein